MRSAFDKTNQGPATDWSYQAATPFFHGGAESFGKNPATFRAFRALSTSFFNAEAKRAEQIDAAVFALIAVISAWPIVLAAQAGWHMLK